METKRQRRHSLIHNKSVKSLCGQLTWLKSVLISRSMPANRSSPRCVLAGSFSGLANATISSWLMYMPRGGFRLWRSIPAAPPELFMLRDRLPQNGPEVGRSDPVRLKERVEYVCLLSRYSINQLNTSSDGSSCCITLHVGIYLWCCKRPHIQSTS